MLMSVSRYLMYNYPITSFVFFTGLFWVTEMVIAASVAVMLSYIWTGGDAGALG